MDISKMLPKGGFGLQDHKAAIAGMAPLGIKCPALLLRQPIGLLFGRRSGL